MGIRRSLSSLFRWAATTIDPRSPGDPALVRLLGGGPSTASGVVVTESRALGYPAVMRGVTIISNAVAKVRPRIYERIGEQDKRRAAHRHARIVSDRPCPEVSGYHFRQTLQQHAMLWGNGCAYIYRRGDGSIDPELGIVPLPPDNTELVRIRGGTVDRNVDGAGELRYVTRVGGRAYTLLPENVFHIHGLSYSGLWGYSVVDVLRETFGLGLAAREFGARFFGQGTITTGFVTYPEGLDEEAEERWASEIKSATQGLGKAHRVILLEHGSTFTPATIPPDAAQFLETRQFEIREIANAIGIQPHKLGDPSRKSYASLEQSNQEHLDDDLDPWLVVWESEYAAKCLTEVEKAQDSHFVEFDRRQFLRTNLAARTSHYVSGMQWGWYSANDVRRKESEPTIGRAGDVRYRPANMIPIDGAAREPVYDGGDGAAAGDVDARTLAGIDTRTCADVGEGTRLEAASTEAAAWRLQWAELCQAILARLARRLLKQAIAKAATPAQFGGWVGSIGIDADTPRGCARAAEALVAQIRLRLEILADHADSVAQLRLRIQAEAGAIEHALPQQIAAEAARELCGETETGEQTGEHKPEHDNPKETES